jgi:serine/threonine-protein kinase
VQFFMIGKTLAHYRILEKIGAGGMGEVYRAHDQRLERDVALKVLPAGTLTNEIARKRFRKEALALSKLNHPNIQTVHDFDTRDGVDFLVTEYIPGVTLDDKLAAGPLSEKEIARLGAQLTEGLAAAHAQRVVHRDLKPGNLRLTADGRLKILDFGIARLLPPVREAATETFTEMLGVAGTLPYMAPEQLRGEAVDARSDIYAVGVVLYEMATGRRPFQAKLSTALTDAILHQPPPLPSGFNRRISPVLENIVLKALEKDPERRYQSARELRVDLERFGTPVSATVPVRPRRLRRRWPLAGVGTLATLAAVLLTLNVSGLRHRLLGRAPPGQITSLAVLPLENLTHEPEQEYFADGMTDALITDLSKIGALKVISRTSSMRYKGSDKPLPEIARELGVDGIVEGSVLRAGDQVRITAQLIHARTDEHVWSRSYDRSLSNILSLQSEVARAIAEEIEVSLTPQEEARLAGTRPVDPASHEAYLKGRYHWNKRTPEGLKRGFQYFEQAIEENPTNALAYAGLADSYALHWSLPAREAARKEKAAALRALEIDDTLAEAHISLADAKDKEWDWLGADREYKRALELNPNYATAHHWYSIHLNTRGKHQQAVAEARRALELDPLSVIIQANLGGRLYYARRYDEALEQCGNALEMDPDFVIAHVCLGYVYLQQARFGEAVEELQTAVELSERGPPQLGELGHAYAVSGNRSKAMKILAELTRLSQRMYVPPYHIATIHVGLGEKKQAFKWLERSYQELDIWLPFLKTDPRYDSLRSDPRAQDLLRRVGLSP